MGMEKETMALTSKWIKRNARPLEAARWHALMEGGLKSEVIHYIRAFQNDDGGFGHGIEPDFWLPESSPMATWAAGQYLFELDVASKERVVLDMISYLLETYDEETGMWPSVLPEHNNHPHAPWWHWKEGVQQNWMFNPGAELAGFLIHWSYEDSEAAKTGWVSVEKAVAHLMAIDLMDFHEVNCFQRLMNVLFRHKDKVAAHTPFTFEEVNAKTVLLAERCIEKDPHNWGSSYKPLPLDLIHSPKHILAEKHPRLLKENLDFYLETINEDGVWDLTWDWGDGSEASAVSKRQWQGILAVDRYQKLKAFGRLPE
ncbi:hypothetical protein DXT76_15210 [Halobacillus trueperi]|uniref:Uncharacterized protein n=1 Tax=Halobacillus trueperi TaxID=156205 RepID=A0A3D8VLL6_9BACI|nr:hypothetical protein [Halobacillus trueperi]RDY70071.1 hypothetical protein DXT76_15210 [Halobacillus trueperi]